MGEEYPVYVIHVGPCVHAELERIARTCETDIEELCQDMIRWYFIAHKFQEEGGGVVFFDAQGKRYDVKVGNIGSIEGLCDDPLPPE